jgi:hypothetical protein
MNNYKKGVVMKVLIAKNPEALAAVNPHVTEEAEYGDTVVEGSLLTLAHHGARSGNVAPCIANVPPRVLPLGDARIGISHVDLDTVGGIAKLIGSPCQDGHESFWELAAFVDVNGPHKIATAARREPVDVARLYAYWAWAKDHKTFAPNDGTVLDVTADVILHIDVLGILLDTEDTGEKVTLLAAGEEFRAGEEELNKASFLDGCCSKGITIARRSSPEFCNHLYNLPKELPNDPRDAVLAFNETHKSITLSFSDGQGDACAIMQKAFGPEAGGHKGIAGSPRGTEYTVDDLHKVFNCMGKE